MQQALLVRLRPSGPWRYGPSDGALDRVDTLYRSDRLFSAVSIAMRQLGFLDDWLNATACSERPAVAFTSLFPFNSDALYITPPANLWPPPSSLVTSPSPVFLMKVRWRAAHFVPLSLVDSLLIGQPVLADQWIPDPESGCLLRRDRPSSSPFRAVSRASAPVDRLKLTSADSASSACVEFEPGAGLWTVARFLDSAAHQTWNEPLSAAFRLLADSGFGGGRSKGWGQVKPPDFETGNWPALILPKVGRAARNDVHEEQTSRSYWLMSLYSPAPQDTVNWSGGQYELGTRNGRVDGSSGALKKSVRMVVEGCVLDTAAEPVGRAVDVAPEGFAHPVYRSGIALSLMLPLPKPRSEDLRAIEEIVPPELEATPFPMPEPEIQEPEPDQVPAPLEDPDEEPGYEPVPLEDPDEEPEHPPLEEPEEPEPARLIEQASVPEMTPLQAPEMVPASAPESSPLPAPDVTHEPTPEGPHNPAPEITPEPPPQHAPELVPDPEPERVPEPAPETIPEPAPEPLPEPAPEHVPDPGRELPPEPEQAPIPEPAHEPTPNEAPPKDAHEV